MSSSARGRKFVDILPPVLVGLLLLAGWEAWCWIFAIPSYLVPSPTLIAKTFALNAPALMHSLWITLRVTFIALALSIAIGTIVAFLFVQSPIIERSFFPYAVILQVTPIVAIAPLIIILVKNTEGALIICATIIAIFPIISNTTVGLRSIDAGHQDLFAINRPRVCKISYFCEFPARCHSSSQACGSPVVSP
jgi:NitT/TauT family transport system permease protein